MTIDVQQSFKKILVATDFTKSAEQAVRLGLEIARTSGASLHVLHIVPKEGYGVTGVGMLGAAEFARRDARRLEVELLQRGYLEGIRYQISVEKGEVWPVIAEVTEAEGINLVVVGSHRRSRLGKLFVGSTAERIFRRASCPVLVAGPKLRSSDWAPWPRKMLVPIDLSGRQPRVVPLAKSLAHRMQAHLIFLHVSRTKGREATYNQDRAIRFAKSLMREFVASPVGVGEQPECVVETGEPADVIVRMATERARDVVLLGVPPPSALSDRLGSSTAYRVIQWASCPVLTVSTMLGQRGCGEEFCLEASEDADSLASQGTVLLSR